MEVARRQSRPLQRIQHWRRQRPAARLPNGAVPISASLRASCTSETMGSDSGDGRMASIEAKVESLAVSVAAIAKAVEETRQGMSEMRKAMASKE